MAFAVGSTETLGLAPELADGLVSVDALADADSLGIGATVGRGFKKPPRLTMMPKAKMTRNVATMTTTQIFEKRSST